MSQRRSLLFKRPGGAFEFGNALTFDGVNDMVTTPILSSTTPFAASFWAKDMNINGATFGDSAPNNSSYGLLTNTTTLRFRSTGGTNNNFSITAMTASVWYHFYVERDGSNNMRLFQNGVESSSGTLSNTTGQVRFDVIGTRGDVNNPSSATYDEMCYRSGTPPANPAAVAAALYNGGDGDFANLHITTPTYYLRLNESGTATTAVDISGNGNDGTLNNFPSSGMWNPH